MNPVQDPTAHNRQYAGSTSQGHTQASNQPTPPVTRAPGQTQGNWTRRQPRPRAGRAPAAGRRRHAIPWTHPAPEEKP